MQFSKVLFVLFPVAVLAAPIQSFKIPTLDPNTVAPKVPVIDRRVPQTDDTCDECSSAVGGLPLGAAILACEMKKWYVVYTLI
ncbi:hypothetical protein LZ30DRAFT_560258, partial [Colletotrichum cereale]